jgi:hypothetical protein
MRASTPTVATPETTKPVMHNQPITTPKLPAGSVHMTNPGGGKVPVAKAMGQTHDYARGMQGVSIRHKA